MIFSGLLNAPNRGQLLPFFTYYFRLVTFDVTWTFIDKYIPNISTTDELGQEISYNIRQLPYQPHLLNNLEGTLVFTVASCLLIIMWPRTKLS